MDKEWEWSFAKTKDWVQSSWLSRDIKISRPLFLTCCVAAFLLGYAATALLVTYPTKDGGHIAAWVQAFGSIGAIAGAVYVVRLQSTLDRKESIFQRSKRRRCYVLAAQNLYDRTQGIREDWLYDQDEALAKWVSFDRQNIVLALAAVKEIPIYDLDDYSDVSFMVMLIASAQGVYELLEVASSRKKEGLEIDFDLNKNIETKFCEVEEGWQGFNEFSKPL